jgi:hypothetical protein
MTTRRARSDRTRTSIDPGFPRAAIPAKWQILGLAALLWLSFGALGAPPPVEKLLPEDTLFLLTAPDYAKLRDIFSKMPQVQFWNDPAMKPFREKFLSRVKQDFTEPLERELNVRFDDYLNLPQGQVTVAITQNGWQGKADPLPAFLLLVDAKDKSAQLKTSLADFRKKWLEAKKPLKVEKVRNFEFMVLSLSSNDVPKTIRQLLPPKSPPDELEEDEPASKSAHKDELVIGQVDSLLIVGNSLKSVEQVVVRLGGGSGRSLADAPAFQSNHQAMFHDSPFYGWVNAKVLMDVLSKSLAQNQLNVEAINPIDIPFQKILSAVGLTGLKSLAFNFQDSPDGSTFQFFVGVPEASRTGLFKIIAGEPKEAMPPSFVPADVTKFLRWRMDGQKTWAALVRMITDISSQAGSTVDFLLDSADTAAKDKNPDFDMKTNLIANLGDDLITFQKAPRASSPGQPQSPHSLFLLGSPNADQLVFGLRSLLVYLPDQAVHSEREFLGRKIYSVTVPSISVPGVTGAPASPRTVLSYAAGHGYVAISVDAAMLEEFLRSGDTQGKQLREAPGLAAAAQKVLGPGSSLFGYRNDAEIVRATYGSLRKSATTTQPGAENLLPDSLSIVTAGQNLEGWLDFSLLPAFGSIAKYFNFSVYGASASTDGLSLKLFVPTPPGVK